MSRSVGGADQYSVPERLKNTVQLATGYRAEKLEYQPRFISERWVLSIYSLFVTTC